MRYMLGIDVGGTFTDFVAYDRETRQIDGLEGAVGAGRSGRRASWPASSASPTRRRDRATSGSAPRSRPTPCSSARARSSPTSTTKGFRDVPFIQRGNRKSHYDMSWVKPKPLVKRRHCFELDRADRRLRRRAHAARRGRGARASRAAIRGRPEIEAVAVCLLFSYLNPDHERRVKAILAEELPELPVSISYEVLPKWKEYERASTTHRRRLSQARRRPASCARCAAAWTRPASGATP